MHAVKGEAGWVYMRVLGEVVSPLSVLPPQPQPQPGAGPPGPGPGPPGAPAAHDPPSSAGDL
eukprot:4603153-Pyramimonas_sp.AAC.1